MSDDEDKPKSRYNNRGMSLRPVPPITSASLKADHDRIQYLEQLTEYYFQQAVLWKKENDQLVGMLKHCLNILMPGRARNVIDKTVGKFGIDRMLMKMPGPAPGDTEALLVYDKNTGISAEQFREVQRQTRGRSLRYAGAFEAAKLNIPEESYFVYENDDELTGRPIVLAVESAGWHAIPNHEWICNDEPDIVA